MDIDYPSGTQPEETLPETQADRWWNLSSYENQTYHQPDLEAQRAILSMACSHYYPGNDPVWGQLIGSSGAGKSEVGIVPLEGLPLTQSIGRLTPKCFLSSWAGGSNSLLKDPSMIWLAKDFGTFLALRSENRQEVAAALREIWDGAWTSKTGVGKIEKWEGKVTLIIAATPEFERSWAAMRSLGERFLTVRWRTPGKDGVKGKVRQNMDHKAEIRAELRRLVALFCDVTNFPKDSVTPTDDQMARLDALADILAILRVHVHRESDGKREIEYVPEPEASTRIIASLSQIARTHAAMMGRSRVMEEDLDLAARVAMDSVPPVRKKILDIVAKGGADYGDILEESRIPESTLKRSLEDLAELGVLDRNTGTTTEWVRKLAELENSFSQLCRHGRVWQPKTPFVVEIPKPPSY